MKTIALFVFGVSLIASTVHAQPAGCEAWSQAEHRCIKAFGAPSLADALDASRAASRVAAALIDLPARRAAIASLRAVSSVVAGGANTQEFTAYNLAARVQVDTLRATDANAAVRHVWDAYADAVRLLIARRLKRLTATEVQSVHMAHLDIPARYARLDAEALWVAAQALLTHADAQLALME